MDMSKFTVGDKVVRTGNTLGEAKKGGVYEVSELSDNKYCASTGINLKGHPVEDGGKFNYEESSFELYTEDHLTPLEAAKALLNRQELQIFDELDNNWYRFYCDLSDVTLKDLENIKFRYKPETVTINGVEVLAPVELPRYTEGYVPSICYREVQTASAGKGRIMWATKEDAQKALDAMLIPFKESDND